MKFLELSSKRLNRDLEEIFNDMENTNYRPELVIFLGKGGLYIGEFFSNKFNCRMEEILVQRQEPSLKKIVKPLLSYLPKYLLKFMRNFEINSNYHVKNENRIVNFNMDKNHLKDYSKILLVDDSIDSGFSMDIAKKKISELNNNAEIKIAALNIFDTSKSVIDTDFYLYNNTALMGPWSLDSEEYKMFLLDYKRWKGESK